MLGLKHTTVQLVPHSYKWQYLFQEEVINIRRVLNNRYLRLEHVGSTALTDIAAKPILDIFIPYDNLNAIGDLCAPLATLGYELVTDAHAYKLFIKGSEEARTHHLSFTSPNNNYWKETIQFRDYLLANPLVAKAYEAEKLKLASEYSTSRRNYSLNKARFIQSVLRDINSQTSGLASQTSLLSTHVSPKPTLPSLTKVISTTQAELDSVNNTTQVLKKDTTQNVSSF